MLKQVNVQYRRERVWRPAALPACLWIVRFDRGNKHRPGQDRLNLSEELLGFSLLLGGGELVVQEAELLNAHHLGSVLHYDPM